MLQLWHERPVPGQHKVNKVGGEDNISYLANIEVRKCDFLLAAANVLSEFVTDPDCALLLDCWPHSYTRRPSCF